MIIETDQDKGVFTSLKNAGLVWNSGRGNEAICGLTDKGFEFFKNIMKRKGKENKMQLGLNKLKIGESKEIRSHHLFARDIKANILKHGMNPEEFEISPLKEIHEWGYKVTRKGPEVPKGKPVVYHFNTDGNFIKMLEEPFKEVQE